MKVQRFSGVQITQVQVDGVNLLLDGFELLLQLQDVGYYAFEELKPVKISEVKIGGQ